MPRRRDETIIEGEESETLKFSRTLNVPIDSPLKFSLLIENVGRVEEQLILPGHPAIFELSEVALLKLKIAKIEKKNPSLSEGLLS